MINKDMYNTFDHIDFTYYYPDHFNQKEDKDYLNSKIEPKFQWICNNSTIFKLPLDISVKVEPDAIILNDHQMEPEINGFEGQKAYNLYDMISWTYHLETWVKDISFTSPEKSCKSVNRPLDVFSYNTYSINIFNYRGELVDTISDLELENDGNIYFTLNKDVSNILKPGIYKYRILEKNLISGEEKIIEDQNPYILVK